MRAKFAAQLLFALSALRHRGARAERVGAGGGGGGNSAPQRTDSAPSAACSVEGVEERGGSHREVPSLDTDLLFPSPARALLTRALGARVGATDTLIRNVHAEPAFIPAEPEFPPLPAPQPPRYTPQPHPHPHPAGRKRNEMRLARGALRMRWEDGEEERVGT